MHRYNKAPFHPHLLASSSHVPDSLFFRSLHAAAAGPACVNFSLLLLLLRLLLCRFLINLSFREPMPEDDHDNDYYEPMIKSSSRTIDPLPRFCNLELLNSIPFLQFSIDWFVQLQNFDPLRSADKVQGRRRLNSIINKATFFFFHRFAKSLSKIFFFYPFKAEILLHS